NMRVAFGYVADAGANIERRARHIEPEHLHASPIRRHKAKQRLDEGALAGAVRPEKSHGSRRERGGDAAQRRLLAVNDGDPFEGRDGRGDVLRHSDRYTADAAKKVPAR